MWNNDTLTGFLPISVSDKILTICSRKSIQIKNEKYMNDTPCPSREQTVLARQELKYISSRNKVSEMISSWSNREMIRLCFTSPYF